MKQIVKKIAFLVLLLGLIALLAGATRTQTAQAETVGGLSCTSTAVVKQGTINSFNFTVECDGDVEGFLDFGDGTGTGLSVPPGTTSHDYSYTPGGIMEYNTFFTVGNSTFHYKVVIDDSPPINNCTTVTSQGQAVNHIVINFNCSPTTNGWGNVSFGDGTETDVEFTNGSAQTSHWYSYTPGGTKSFDGLLTLGSQSFPFEITISD